MLILNTGRSHKPDYSLILRIKKPVPCRKIARFLQAFRIRIHLGKNDGINYQNSPFSAF